MKRRYKLRCELSCDLYRLLGLMGRTSCPDLGLADVRANLGPSGTLTFTAEDLMPLVKLIRKVPDGHRMLQTLGPAKDWSGSSENWDERLEAAARGRLRADFYASRASP